MASTTATTTTVSPDPMIPAALAPSASPAEPARPLAQSPVPEQRVVLRGIGWDGFEAILEAVGDQPAVRPTYDRGDLELMSPSIDPNVDPPPDPDLALEVEISRSVLDRMGIYAALRIPEIWRFDGERPIVERLQLDGTSASHTTSLPLPLPELDRLVDWIFEADGVVQTTWIHRFREWARTERAPRLGERGNIDRS
jgi:Putative restriction endonuclease